MNIKGKHITILGAERSGIAAAKLAKAQEAIPFISDYSEKPETASALKDANIAFEFGKHTEKVFECDFIITSPGIPSNADVVVKARSKGIKIISEIEFASWFCKGKIIAITGSNGKTTTTMLCNHVLNNSGIKTYSAGNIGVAFSDIVLNVKENEYVALEVSSFQLDNIDTFKPKYAIVLNITPDHLDRYENDFDKYALSKLMINKNQTSEDYFIYNYDDEYLAKTCKTAANKISISLKEKQNNGLFIKDNKFCFVYNGNTEVVAPVNVLQIKGEHNQYNAMAVIAVAKLIGIDNKLIEESLFTFPGVEHRLEFIREINGIRFINDSKATNVDSVWYALRSYNKPIHLILGGKDKGNDYDKIKRPVQNNVQKIYAVGSSAEKIIAYFSSVTKVEKYNTLEDAVTEAYNNAMAGEIVLLSPACASFDMFDNYEHRGKVFKQIVERL